MGRFWFIAALLVVLCISGCSTESSRAEQENTTAATVKSVEPAGAKGEEAVNTRIKLNISQQEYEAVLEDNLATRQLIAKFPMTLEMEELNGNEKYYQFAESFPAGDEEIGQIHAGDIMLFAGHYVVIFYKDFPTQYRYTRLGRIESPKGLAEALGQSKAAVSFRK